MGQIFLEFLTIYLYEDIALLWRWLCDLFRCLGDAFTKHAQLEYYILFNIRSIVNYKILCYKHQKC